MAGNLYKIYDLPPERWEALKAKLGAVIEIEAANLQEAWKLYEQRKQGS